MIIWPHPPKRGHAGGVHACGVLSRLDRCASRAPGTRASRALIAQSAPKSFQGRELTPGSPDAGSNLRKVMQITSGKFVQVCRILSRLDRCASRAPGTRASRALIVQSAPKSFQGWELTPGSPGVEGTLRNVMSLENVLGKYSEDSPVRGGACKRWLSLPPARLTPGLPDSKLARLLAEHPRSS